MLPRLPLDSFYSPGRSRKPLHAVLVHTFNHSTRETETAGSLWVQASLVYRVSSDSLQSYRETCLEKPTNQPSNQTNKQKTLLLLEVLQQLKDNISMNRDNGFSFFFEIESLYVTQAGLWSSILLSLPPRSWHYKCMPPDPATWWLYNDTVDFVTFMFFRQNNAFCVATAVPEHSELHEYLHSVIYYKL